MEDPRLAGKMMSKHDERAFDLYLLLLRDFDGNKEGKIILDYDKMAKSLGLYEKMDRTGYRRQITRSLRKLQNKYSLIKFKSQYGKDAIISLKDYDNLDKPYSYLDEWYFEIPANYWTYGWDKKLSMRAKFCYLINLAYASISDAKPWWFASRDNTSFSLEGEYRNDHSEFIKEWQFWLSFRRSFDMPIPFVKTKGAVEGNVFIDENNNGVVDKDEAGLPKITFLLEGYQADTNRNGRFKFPSVVPGEYELDIDITSLPVGLAPRIILPYKAKVVKGEIAKIEVPLVRTCKVRGAVFEDKNRDSKIDEGEEGLTLVRVLLIRDDEIYKETFSDTDGKYSFTGILPGKYDVSIDEAWLPKRFKLTTPSTYSVDLMPGQEILNVDFGSIEKEKPIIKTFTTPGIGAIEPEKVKP